MTFRSDVDIDWTQSPRIITVQSPSTEITIQDLYDTLRIHEARVYNATFDRICSAGGKEDLGGGVAVGVTMTLLNAQLAFEARPGPTYVQCKVDGGNLVAVDNVGATLDPISPTAFTQIVRTASSSATQLDQFDIRYAAYNGGVTIETGSVNSGTDYPVGTARAPVNNMFDAISIANTLGLEKLYVHSDLVLSTGSFSDKILIGESPKQTRITFTTGCTLSGVEVEDAYVTGTMSGVDIIKNCTVCSVSGFSGLIRESNLTKTLWLASGSTHIGNCHDATPDANPTKIDLLNAGENMHLAIRHFSGRLQIQNKTTGSNDITSIDMSEGHIILDSSLSEGVYVLRGLASFDNNVTGNAVVDSEGLVNIQSLRGGFG